jgi:hypothetical protein
VSRLAAHTSELKQATIAATASPFSTARSDRGSPQS